MFRAGDALSEEIGERMEAGAGNFWIGVISKAHAQLGVAGGFIQLGHGKKAPLQRLHGGDQIVVYAPREAYPDGAVLQHFVALGRIVSGEIYQAEMAPEFKPYRLDIFYSKCRTTPIRPLIARLSFIKDKIRWGGAFRYGQLKIPAEDFNIIAEAMGAVREDAA